MRAHPEYTTMEREGAGIYYLNMSNKDEFIIDTKLWSLEREKEKDSCCKS
jgi:hypothetical protein